jgi:hypothetical protein
MSVTDGHYEPEIDPSTPVEERDDYVVRVKRGHLRALEKKGKGREDLEEKLAASERENLMRRAGIDVDSDKGQYFLNGYDGAATVEAVQEKARAVGVLEAPAPEPDPEPEPEPEPDTPLEEGEADVGDERRALAEQAPPDQAPKTNPYEEADSIREKVIKDGGHEHHALGAVFNSLANAAHRGDKRVVIERER